MKVYLVCVMDEWSNITGIGYYTSLEDEELLKEINSYFKNRVVLIDDEEIENFELKPGDLCEYPSTYGSCFDRTYDFDDGYLRIFGFICDLDCLIRSLEELRNK